MKLVLLIIGLVLLAVGAVGALVGLATASSAQAEYDFLCPSGPAPPQLCAALLSTVATYQAVAVGMGIVAIVGLGVTIAAAIMKGPLFAPAPVPMYAPMPPPPPMPPAGAATSKPCPQCGRSNRSTDRFCSSCGAPLS